MILNHSEYRLITTDNDRCRLDMYRRIDMFFLNFLDFYELSELRHQWCGQDHAINCARAALRNSDASVQEVDHLLGLLSSELLMLGKDDK